VKRNELIYTPLPEGERGISWLWFEKINSFSPGINDSLEEIGRATARAKAEGQSEREALNQQKYH